MVADQLLREVEERELWEREEKLLALVAQAGHCLILNPYPIPLNP